MSIKKILKDKLVEAKQQKSRALHESNIVKNRLNFIVESSKIKTKKQINEVFNNILYEMIYLHNQGFSDNVISENVESVLSVLSTVFKGKDEEVKKHFRESVAQWVVNSLNISNNDTLKSYLKNSLNSTDLNDVPKLLTDYTYLSEKIANAVVESFLEELNEKMGGEFMTAVQSSITDVLKSSDLKEKIKSRIGGITRPLMDNLDKKFEEKLNSIKSSLVPNSDIRA